MRLTLRSLRARAVRVKLRRPLVARIATMAEWPIILVDLATEEGVTGRSYVTPYSRTAIKALIPALHDVGETLKGRALSPVDLYAIARKALHFVGYEGLSMIAVSGLDMAAWDALAQAACVPLCVLLGGSVGPVRAYNSSGLWLGDPATLGEQACELRDEGGFTAMKLRLGRDDPRVDVAA